MSDLRKIRKTIKKAFREGNKELLNEQYVELLKLRETLHAEFKLLEEIYVEVERMKCNIE